jgi:hypothetical protein
MLRLQLKTYIIQGNSSREWLILKKKMGEEEEEEKSQRKVPSHPSSWFFYSGFH